jgi:hypothetical protein
MVVFWWWMMQYLKTLIMVVGAVRGETRKL